MAHSVNIGTKSLKYIWILWIFIIKIFLQYVSAPVGRPPGDHGVRKHILYNINNIQIESSKMHLVYSYMLYLGTVITF